MAVEPELSEPTTHEEVIGGAEALITKAAETSNGNPRLAIAQMLIGTVGIAKIFDMTVADLDEGYRMALREAGYEPV
jgi:hypothetical protein